MSNELLTLAFNVNVSGAKKSVLIALADRANRGGYCYPSLADIAYRAGCDRRTAMRSITALEALGYIAVIRDQGKVNNYLVLLADLSTTSDNQSQQKVIHSGDNLTKTGDIVTKTSDKASHKPINPINQKTRARGVAENPPKNLDRQQHRKTPNGLEGLRSIKSIFAGMPTKSPPNSGGDPIQATGKTLAEPT